MSVKRRSIFLGGNGRCQKPLLRSYIECGGHCDLDEGLSYYLDKVGYIEHGWLCGVLPM